MKSSLAVEWQRAQRANSSSGFVRKSTPGQPPFSLVGSFSPFAFPGCMGFCIVALLVLASAAGLAAEVSTNLEDLARSYYGSLRVTCELAYYADFPHDGRTHGYPTDIHLSAAKPAHTNSPMLEVQGVVMEVLTPKELAGKTICVWLDGPPAPIAKLHFKPGVVYSGWWPSNYIGTLEFKGPLPFEPMPDRANATNSSPAIVR